MSEIEKKILRRFQLYDYYYVQGVQDASDKPAPIQKEHVVTSEEPSRRKFREYLYSDEMVNKIVVILPNHNEENV